MLRMKPPFNPEKSGDYRYSESVAEAVKWLGDRYLLARPIRIPSSMESPPKTQTHDSRIQRTTCPSRHRA